MKTIDMIQMGGYSLIAIEAAIASVEQANNSLRSCFEEKGGFAYLINYVERDLLRLSKFLKEGTEESFLPFFSSEWHKRDERKKQVAEFLKEVKYDLERYKTYFAMNLKEDK